MVHLHGRSFNGTYQKSGIGNLRGSSDHSWVDRDEYSDY